jgi:hypothetical protein
MKLTTDGLARPVPFGQLLIWEPVQLFFVIVVLQARQVWMFALVAAPHILWAIFTRGCYWWNPNEKQMPTWAGRAILLGSACVWLAVGRYLSN